MSAALKEIVALFGVEFDAKQLEKGDGLIDSMVDKLKGFGKHVAAAFAVDAIIGFGKEILVDADALAKQSQALGVSAAQLQGWEHAASLSGSSAEGFVGALTKFNKALAGTRDGTGPASDALKVFGVTADDVKKKTPLELLDQIADGFGAVTDTTKRTAATMALFGKSGNELAPLLLEGSKGIAKLRAEVGDLGASFDEAFLKDAQEVNDNVDRLKLGFKGLAIQVLSAVLPAITQFSAQAVKAIKGVVSWVRSTKLIQAALLGLTSGGIYKLLTSLPALIARFGGLRVILGRLALFVLRFIAPLLILEDILVFLAGGKSAIGRGLDAAFGPGTAKNIQNLVAELVKFFGLFKTEPDKVRASFATLPDDLAKELGGFGRFLGGWGQNIVEVGLFVTNALTGGWDNFVSKAKAGGQGILLALNIVWTELKFAGLTAAAALSDAFDNVWNGIISGAQAALSAMLDVLSKLPGTESLVKDLRVKVEGLSGSRGSADAQETISKLHDQARLALASQYDVIAAQATAPPGSSGSSGAPTNITNNNNVNVTVPSGTPADVANGVGRASGRAVEKGSLRGTKAALVPTAG